MRAAPASAGTFLNDEEKENKRRGIQITGQWTHVWRRMK